MLAAAMLPSFGSVAEVSELGMRNIAIVMDRVPSLDLRDASASEALLRTYQEFHLVNGFYLDHVDAPSGFATAWHQYQLLNMLDIAATLGTTPGMDAASMLTDAIDAMDAYWDDSPGGHPAGYNAGKDFGFTRPDRYVDDNLWMAQLLMRQYQRTGDEAYVLRAKQIVDLFLSQRDLQDGASYWKVQFSTEQNRDKCVVSNATAISSLIDVYLAGYGDKSFVAAAEQALDWVQRLLDPETGLYFDKIRGDGEIDTTIYTYVQAEVLESMVHLSKVDRTRFPLTAAVEFAERSMNHFAERGGYGIGKFDVIYLRSLMHVASLVDDAALTENVQQAIVLAKGVIPSSSTALPDAAAAAAIVALSELPTEKWAALA